MAENEDPKGKTTLNTAARSTGPDSGTANVPGVKKAPQAVQAVVKPSDAQSPVSVASPAGAKSSLPDPASARPDAKSASKTVAPVKAAASAPVKPTADKAVPNVAPPVAKTAVSQLPGLGTTDLKASKITVPGVQPPVTAPITTKASQARAPQGKAPAPKGKPGPKPKIKIASEGTSPTPEPVQTVVPAKVAQTEPVAKVAEDVKRAAEFAPVPKAVAPNAASKTAFNDKPAFAGLFNTFMLEETTMDLNTNFSGFQNAITDAQAKAKAAFEKSTSVLGEVTEFTKGNIEAAVESGKIWAEGVQSLGSEFVAESRTAFEAATGDIKELAGAKSPTDFFKLQSDLVRKNFDTAVAYGSKNSEAVLKLLSDSFAPISGRVSVAVDKARTRTAAEF